MQFVLSPILRRGLVEVFFLTFTPALFLRSIHLTNYKNHADRSLDFSRKINCFIGPNGMGKTNILDAIHYLSLTKSYFSSTDQQNIRIGADFMRLTGAVTVQEQDYRIVCRLPQGRKKDFTVNDLPYKRMSDHVGMMPVVMIAPDDSVLISGSSEERRKFLDNTLSQTDHEYLEHLVRYNKYLDQRNALLKSMNAGGRHDAVLLEGYDEQLVRYGESVYRRRRQALSELEPIFSHYHRLVSLEREQTSFSYESTMNERPLADQLRDNLPRQILLERTSAGPHRDDIAFMLGDTRLKRFGSQGQQKSFLIALKLAQYHYIRAHKSFHPFLLIDDIFDKIDGERSRQLVQLLSGEDFGQIFITDTDEQHITDELGADTALFDIYQIP
ncbi:MAG: DNA replication/repair protein RecF [Bacteroidetes bacterium]|nr:DNA replication/repair protein RecF [Bacteroidota bacterium]